MGTLVDDSCYSTLPRVIWQRQSIARMDLFNMYNS